MDIYTINLQTKKLKRLTTNQMADTHPVWHPDGTAISYTSNSNGVPNIHTINLSNNNISINSDVGDGVWSHQWTPSDSLLLARTLEDVDTVRLVKVSPFRTPNTKPTSLRNNYTSWLSAGPDVSFVSQKPKTIPEISDVKKYKFTKHVRHLASIVLPFGYSQAWQND
jgi:Tol biopolymer transport system component